VSGVVGLETEYGIYAPALSADEAARKLFQPVVAWGRGTSVFTPSGGRLYLDIGSHPEYATAECSTLAELLAQDLAGDLIVEGLAKAAAQQSGQRLWLFKNNLDSAGHAFGSHENYQVPRARSGELPAKLVPFLVTRQIVAGAGHVLVDPRGARYVLSPRADHVAEVFSSSTTRSRPMINGRDEPHADGERFRRLHVIVGDSNMSQAATRFKVGALRLVLRGIEQGRVVPELELAKPVAALREISHRWRQPQPVELADGRHLKPADIQAEYLRFAEPLAQTAEERAVIDLWRRAVDGWQRADFAGLETELDWLAKLALLDRYRQRTGEPLASPKVARLALAYHQLGENGLRPELERTGLLATVVEPAAVRQAMGNPPDTTRARLRGQFVAAARAAGEEYTVDWVRLKVGQGQTVSILDPLDSHNQAAERLIERLETEVAVPAPADQPGASGKPAPTPGEAPNPEATELPDAAPGALAAQLDAIFAGQENPWV
jgi:proteasome accessory factor A